MNTLERKIDLLIGVIQDLSEKVNGYGGMKPPVHRWKETIPRRKEEL